MNLRVSKICVLTSQRHRDIGYAQEINHCEYITAYKKAENFSATAHYDSMTNWNKDLLTVPFDKLVQVPDFLCVELDAAVKYLEPATSKY